MKKLLNNEKGLTLVEVLAVFVIGVIVLTLMTGVITSIQKQFKEQSTQTGNLFDSTLATKMITKDVRSANSVSISCDGKTLVIDGAKVNITYTFSGSQIKKTVNANNATIENIERFRVSTPIANNECKSKGSGFLFPVKQFDMEIKGLNIKERKTTITIRSGDDA